jgi:hypothetical protein
LPTKGVGTRLKNGREGGRYKDNGEQQVSRCEALPSYGGQAG